MISLSYSDVAQNIAELSAMGSKLRPKPVRFYPYLKRVLDADRETEFPEFPLDIKIAKANKYLLRGDFSPETIIHLEKPVEMDDGTPMWFNSASPQVWLRFGYTNLDARNICKERLDMECIHGFMGGSSGHGKSVTLNSMIGAICYEYAPWEVELHLSDAKIVEFKKYGVGHRIPHIASIAATEDPDFVISVLDRAKREMQERQKIFGSIGASNLKNFRKKTGLMLPRVIIIMDEVESTFRLAGRQADKIGALIDDFARLGRAAGYHIFMATQNLSSDIPKSAIGQIRLRMCLGANETTSQAVLGNAGATDNFGRIGRLIVNTETMNGGDTTPFNRKYQTPLLEDEEFEMEMSFLEQKGQEVGFRRNMAFYDEEDVKTIEKFDPIVNKAMTRMQADHEITHNRIPIILGMPAFVTDDKDELLKIWLDQKDVENILIASTSSDRVCAHLHNITAGLSAGGYAIQYFTTDLENKKWIVNPMVTVEARSAEQPPLTTIGSLVRKRLFLLQLDQVAKGATFDRSKVEQAFERDKLPKSAWGNALLCKRYIAYSTLLSKNNKEWDDVRYLFPSFLEIYHEFEKSNTLIKEISASDFAKAAFIVGDISKIVGYGRDTRDKYVQVLKKAMQDASRVGVVYVIYSRSMEGLTSLVSGIRYTIFDLPDSKDWGRMRTDEPRELKSVLALLFDNMDNDVPQKKFKRTLLKEEF